uniref:ANK_REP_REGION domain-containing protein n=1 Tax=Meloidogyne hapla TaxID=6305 RepID=A0A1I8AYC2_MELHA
MGLYLERGVPLYMPNKNGALGLHAAAAAGYNDVVKDNYTALTVAVQSGQAAVVETLLGFGADVHIEGGQIGETALHVAAGLPSGNIECAQMLLKSGAQPNVRRSDGMTPLHISARMGNKEMVGLLLAEGADPKLKSKIGETPLHLASKQCHLPVVLLLLEKIGKDIQEVREYVNLLTEDGQSSIHYASQILADQNHFIEEDAKIVSTIVDAGGDCEKQTINALHLAAANGHIELTRLLLKYKAFVNSKKWRSSITLRSTVWTCKVSSNACPGRLFTYHESFTFEEHGASLEAITLNNQTALHFAAKFGQLIVAQTLLAFGANPNAKDDKGQTPLHLAAENDYPDVVKLFLKMKQNNHAVLTAVDHSGFTCAHIAAMKGSLAVVRELMMIDKVQSFLRLWLYMLKQKILEATTLHMASSGGHSRIVKILLENGASPDDENANGMTPLCLAAWNGHVPILACFDKKYWRRCSKKTGLNAFHVAAYKGHSDFINEMIKHIPASVRSEPPTFNHFVVKEFATEVKDS